ncbi:MAG: hypothetical protein WD894_05520 [Pirellulales bacterium]
MASALSIEVARKAQAIYERDLRNRLEKSNLNAFVAIEPESGDYFLGETLSEAIQAARAAHPERLPFTLRVGHRSTVKLGVLSQ